MVRRATTKAYMVMVGLFTLFVAILFAGDLTLIFGLNIVNYKDPTHTKSVLDALTSSDLAPLLHLLLLVAGVMAFLRLRRIDPSQ